MLKRTASFRSSAATFALIVLAATPAFGESANLKAMSFSASNASGTIHVASTDKAQWNKIKTGVIQFSAHMNIDTWHPGYVDDVAVVAANCGLDNCPGSSLLWSDSIVKRDYEATEAVGLPTGKLAPATASAIIDRCNQKLQADGPTKSHGFTHDVPVTLIADSEEAWGNIDNVPDEAQLGAWPYFPIEVNHERTDTLPVQVVCDPVVKSPTNDLAHDFGEFDVENVKLFLTTYQSTHQGSNPGTVCPALKVTSRAQTNQAGPVTMRIWRQKDGGPITSDVVQAWASFSAAKNGYFATYEKWEDVGTTSYFQFKTEIVENSPFAPSDGWKDITVHCTSPGGGGFTDTQDDNDGLPQPQAEWQGELTIADSAGADKSCPRQGQVFFAVTRPEPGDFNYRIQCSNGAFFTGTATGYDQGSGIFEAYGAHNISINRTRSISCTLQELTPAPVTIATDKEDFTCANPTMDPGADDLSSDSRPDFDKPSRPLVMVDPAPECGPNEKLVRGRCVEKPIVAACRSNEKLVGGKCIGISIHCLPGFHQEGLKCVKNDKPSVSIFCKPGFEQKGEKCVRKPVIVTACRLDQIRVNGKCVKKPDVSILCKPGFELKGKTCVRKPVIATACRADQMRLNGKCVKKPEVSILCKPGFQLKGKTCVRKPVIVTACGAGEKLVRGHCVDVKPAAKLKRLASPKPVLTKPTVLKAFKLPRQKRVLPRN